MKFHLIHATAEGITACSLVAAEARFVEVQKAFTLLKEVMEEKT